MTREDTLRDIESLFLSGQNEVRKWDVVSNLFFSWNITRPFTKQFNEISIHRRDLIDVHAACA